MTKIRDIGLKPSEEALDMSGDDQFMSFTNNTSAQFN